MNKSVIEEILETVQTFILLKEQNLVIYSWMVLKNRNRRIAHLQEEMEGGKVEQEGEEGGEQGRDGVVQQGKGGKVGQFSPRVDNREKRLLTWNFNANQELLIHKKLNNKMSDRLFTLPEKSTNKNIASRGLFPTENEQAELGDSEEFQDVVLERLSMLQERIGKLMKQKKEKQQKRGYIGSPLVTRYSARVQAEERSQPSKIASILDRKKKFFESLRKTKEQSPSNIIYNLKYIPVNRLSEQQPTANIQRIKNLIQYSYQQKFIEDIDYFNEAYLRRPQEEHPKTHSRKLSTSLYMNRYNGSRQPRDKIHFKPNNLEMQTVIQPRKRYFREGLYSTDRHSLRKSFISNHSLSAKRNNQSSYN